MTSRTPILMEPKLLLDVAKVTKGWFHRHRWKRLMDRLQRLQRATVARGGKFLGAPEAAVREAVEEAAGVKGGKSRTRRLLWQGRQLLEAAVRKAVEWGKVVKMLVHHVVAVRQGLQVLRQESKKPRRQHQFIPLRVDHNLMTAVVMCRTLGLARTA